MEHGLSEIGPPTTEVVRIGSHHGPCDPPPWSRTTSDLTFGNRFDDPRAAAGRPLAECFRSMYFGSTAEAAFGEVLAGFQPPLALLAKLTAIEDDEPLADTLSGIIDVDPMSGRIRGIVPAEWRFQRLICRLTLDPALRFADLTTIRSRLYLRRELAALAQVLEISDLDFSTILSSDQRRLTQACAAHIHELIDARGEPRYAGIHYVSRHNIMEWRCWALFDDRVRGRHGPRVVEPIKATNQDLLRIAAYYDLAIQVEPGTGAYLRP